MKKKNTALMARQGDILLKSIPEIPEGLKPVKDQSGRLILAHGEVTGHHHSIQASPTTALYAGKNDELYLLVKEGEALLEHQEHGTIQLAPGAYRVVRQREYSPEAIRNVMD
jgi:hypothetical protein